MKQKNSETKQKTKQFQPHLFNIIISISSPDPKIKKLIVTAVRYTMQKVSNHNANVREAARNKYQAVLCKS